MTPQTATAQAAGNQTLSTPKTVLLVDDDASIRAVFGTTLEHYGLTVLRAKHADEALEICRHYREPIDLLLADIMLPPKVRLALAKRSQPTVHGLELMRRVAAIRKNVRVILFSGQPDEVLKGLGSIPNGVLFLRKPFSLDALVRAVFDVLEIPLESRPPAQ